MIAKTAADHKAIFVNACGVFRENALPGGKNALPEDTPLSAMRVSGDDNIDRKRFEIRAEVFGVVGKQDFIALFG